MKMCLSTISPITASPTRNCLAADGAEEFVAMGSLPRKGAENDAPITCPETFAPLLLTRRDQVP
jgi:hypothetical protein